RKGAQEPVGQAVVAGISPTCPNISGLRLPPHWHFLPPGTCIVVGVGKDLGVTPYPVGDPVSGGGPVAAYTWLEGMASSRDIIPAPSPRLSGPNPWQQQHLPTLTSRLP
ncbi:hypothetical protein MC885_001739, partial [Smutsia gigantea]